MKQHFFTFLILLLFGSTLMYAKSYSDITQTNFQNIELPKTSIKINYPTTGTVWEAPSKVELRWDTKNIPSNKTIKFYLSKDDMVVQELGIFENNGFVNKIAVDRGLQNGDNYRVIGIELFPDNKKSIAKYATPFFTIKKLPRPNKIISEEVNDEPAVRDTFDGRKLTYVNEMSVASDKINIYIWDHSRKDGDIVSIYLNGEAVISKYSLEYYKKKIELTLDPTKPNDLFLYAHNLGKFPPNTVSIEITDGKTSENIVLNSDLKSCEAVLINVKE
ncbi:hypothetical protein GH721_03700 [Kriegella sp. EG-1]|nr:hypothetical protein [Flavobacteriaceae bacterium EG-1]